MSCVYWFLGKDEVTGSNPVISSLGSEHVVSMGSGLFSFV